MTKKLHDPDNIGVPANEHTVKPPVRRDTCPAVWRHRRRRPQARRARGTLDYTSHDLAARLRDEGVPASDIAIVAAELERLVPLVGAAGDDMRSICVHPWTAELIARYGDKLCTLLMTNRGTMDEGCR